MKKLFGIIIDKIKCPRRMFLLFFYITFMLAVAGTILLLVFVPEKTVLHYVFYVLSAAGLVYFVYATVLVAPKIKARIILILRRRTFTNNILENYGFRTVVFAAAGFFTDIAYAVFQALVGIMFYSVWNITIALLYFVLVALKGIILFCEIKYKNCFEKQVKTYRVCGYLLNLLTFAIAGIVVLINKAEMYYEYAGNVIYVVAAVTVYKIVSAIIQFIRARGQDSLIVRAIRNVNLVFAVYSVLILQVSLNQAFGNGQNHLLNNVFGGILALFILIISVLMIVKSHKAQCR